MQTDNRRVRMTKVMMKDALLELLEQKDLSEISVTAICAAADVNRSTFYSYYTSPQELLREIEQDVLDRIPASPPVLDPQGEKQLLHATEGFFDYVRDNKRVFRILFSDSVNSGFASRLVDLLCAQHISGKDDIDEAALHYMQRYIANGTVGMLREWINSGFSASSREIAEMMYFFSRKISG